MLGDDYSLAQTLRLGSFSNTLFELLRLLQRMARREGLDKTRRLRTRDRRRVCIIIHVSLI